MHSTRNQSFRLRPLTLLVLSALCVVAEPSAAQVSVPGVDGDIQTVVITSQKRREVLKDTPVAGTVLGTADLARNNTTSLSDLSTVVPSIQVKESSNVRTPIAMRGISTNANPQAMIGLTSGVSILIDGIPVSPDAMSVNFIPPDLQRMEVLKGPQSTLGGRTASAGVINYVSRKPTRTFRGDASITATSDDEYKGSFSMSGPASETAAYSLSAYSNTQTSRLTNVRDGSHPKSRNKGLRGKLLFQPTSDLDITLSARTGEFDNTGGSMAYQSMSAPGGPFEFASLGPHRYGGPTLAQAFAGVTIRPGNTDYNSFVDVYNKGRFSDAYVNIDYNLSNGYTVSSTTAYQRETQRRAQDTPNIAVPMTTGYGYLNQTRQTLHPVSRSQEFKIASPADEPVSFIAGYFYSDNDVSLDTVRPAFLIGFGGAVRIGALDRYTESETVSHGLYGRTTWRIDPATRVLAGLRWNRDKIAFARTQRSADAAPGLSQQADDTGYSTVGDLTLQHDLSKDVMAYATLARGYKPRVWDTAGDLLPAKRNLDLAEREDINHVELGIKGEPLFGKVLVSAALFHTVYRNYQIQVTDALSVVPTARLRNAPKAATTGLEIDGSVALTNATRLTFGLAFIDAEYKKFANADCYPTQTVAQGCTNKTQDLSGATMPDAPRFKGLLGAEHRMAAGNWGKLTLNGLYSYRSSASMTADQNPAARQKAFGLLNLSLTATPNNNAYTVSVFANNVLDRFYLINAEDFFSGLYATNNNANAIIGRPARDARRYMGVRVDYRF
jgi:iron complex outermembrane receptor protein